MSTATEKKQQVLFVKELETVSGALASWAQDRLFNYGWSIEDVKLAIREAAKICGKEI